MIRIKVDFNALTSDGLVKGHQRRASGDFAPGDTVVLHDPAEPGMEYEASVVGLDDAGRALFEPHWTGRPGGVFMGASQHNSFVRSQDAAPDAPVWDDPSRPGLRVLTFSA